MQLSSSQTKISSFFIAKPAICTNQTKKDSPTGRNISGPTHEKLSSDSMKCNDNLPVKENSFDSSNSKHSPPPPSTDEITIHSDDDEIVFATPKAQSKTKSYSVKSSDVIPSTPVDLPKVGLVKLPVTKPAAKCQLPFSNSSIPSSEGDGKFLKPSPCKKSISATKCSVFGNVSTKRSASDKTGQSPDAKKLADCNKSAFCGKVSRKLNLKAPVVSGKPLEHSCDVSISEKESKDMDVCCFEEFSQEKVPILSGCSKLNDQKDLEMSLSQTISTPFSPVKSTPVCNDTKIEACSSPQKNELNGQVIASTQEQAEMRAIMEDGFTDCDLSFDMEKMSCKEQKPIEKISSHADQLKEFMEDEFYQGFDSFDFMESNKPAINVSTLSK